MSPEPLVDAAKAHPHLAACPECRGQFESLAQLDRQIGNLKTADFAPFEGSCPDPALWRGIAGGLTPPDHALVFIDHASRCRRCGPLLQRAVAEISALNEELTEAERARIAALDSAREEWQRNLARRIAGTGNSQADRRRPLSWGPWHFTVPRLAVAAVILVAVIGTGWWIVIQRNQSSVARQLIARAYTEKRTLELRIAGADYAPLRISRGPAVSFTSLPAPLLKAEALITSQLPSHSSDPSWLQAQAQAEVLDGRYDAAVEALHRALELEPRSPALLIDLATAHFQRALENKHKDDFGAAFEYLSQALLIRPDDPVALFNRAIVAEHQFLYQQALDDWQHYLRVDSTSQWAEEARSRAGAIREKLSQHASQAAPLFSPLQVATAAGNPRLASEIDSRVEEYLHEAVRSWLIQAFPGVRDKVTADARSSAAQALFFLARLTAQKHEDRWLADLLRGSTTSGFPEAAAALARSVQANDNSAYDLSRQQAALAEQLFQASGNMAGVLRARFERTFAAQVERHSDACRRDASPLLAESEKSSYTWLQIQFGLEKSVCSVLMGDLGTTGEAAERAMALAKISGYGALYLRAVGFVEERRFAAGDSATGSELGAAGLESYWSAQYPAMRGYNLYAELAYHAEAMDRPALRTAAWREAISLIDSDEDLLLRAMAHTSMANAARAAHLPQLAKDQYAEAARLFAAAPRTQASRFDLLETEVRTAQVEAQQDQFEEAITRLARLQDQIRALSNPYLAQIFYSTLGELQLGRGREVEAEQALRPALALTEKSLATLSSEAERSSWSKDAAPAYLAFVQAELMQGRFEQALEAYEWYLGAPQRGPRNSATGRAELRLALDSPISAFPVLPSRFPLLSGETVLAYAALPGGLAIWVYDNRGINAHWIPGSTDGLQELAERFRRLSSDPRSEVRALHRDARRLYELLIAPVEQDLAPGRTLVLEAEGWLARVPFEALLDSRDRYLLQRFPVVYSLGLDSQSQLRSAAGVSPDLPALIVGSSASSSVDGLIPLPDITAEADAVGRDFHSAVVLKGDQASLNAVRNALPTVAVFHFAGHSLVTPDTAGLMLEGSADRQSPRLLDAGQLRQIPLPNLQLAMLSACDTSEGAGSSRGFNSVTQALLRARVPHVVASRWAVDSLETGKFVADFYTTLLSGTTVSGALRTTSLKLLSNPETSHPYYWSAFAAYGRP